MDMEHDEKDVNRWVDQRLSSLDPPQNWRPDSSAALAQLRRRGRSGNAPRRHRWWLWATVSATAAAAASIAILLLSAPPACANPLGCTEAAHPAPVVAPPAALPAALPAPQPKPAAKPAAAVTRQNNFKESGSLTASVTCELFADYQCPHCAAFYLETLPQLITEYVETGKVRLIHRDFPLSQHPYARLAARYANAAGRLGYYRAAATKLFRTQAVWSGDGDIDRQVAQSVPPTVMKRVRALVNDAPEPDGTLAADEAMAREDHLNQTPTVVIVSKGHRLVVPCAVTYEQIKAYLDRSLAAQ